MKMKTFLENHPHLNYIQRCIRHLRDDGFITEVLDIGKNPLKIEIERPGEKNPGRLLYIAQTMGCDGFFAELRFILHELFFCDTLGLTPVVVMPSASCYCEKEPVNGTTNPFEYYFEPVSDISPEDARQSSAVVKHNYYQRLYIHRIYRMTSGYLPTDEYLSRMAELTHKYIHLNHIVKPLITGAVQEMIAGRRTLGVHVRGADFKRRYINHPNMVTVEEYISQVEDTLKHHPFEQIFLATDDADATVAFRDRFGDMVHCYDDVIRTSGDETVMRSRDARANHHYLLGLEVIRDMYTLAACDGIIARLSNVSLFANIVKRSQGDVFTVQTYINKGIKRTK